MRILKQKEMQTRSTGLKLIENNERFISNSEMEMEKVMVSRPAYLCSKRYISDC